MGMTSSRTVVMRSSTAWGLPRIVVDRAYMPPLLPGNGDVPAASPRGTLCSPLRGRATVLGAAGGQAETGSNLAGRGRGGAIFAARRCAAPQEARRVADESRRTATASLVRRRCGCAARITVGRDEACHACTRGLEPEDGARGWGWTGPTGRRTPSSSVRGTTGWWRRTSWPTRDGTWWSARPPPNRVALFAPRR